MLKTMTPVPLERATFSAILDHILDLVLQLLLLVGPFVFFLRIASLNMASILILTILLLFFISCFLPTPLNLISISTHIYRRVLNITIKLPFLARRLAETSHWTIPEDISFEKMALVNIFLGTTLRFLVLAARPYCIAKALYVDLPFTLFFMTTPLLMLSFVLNITPGGLGIREIGRYAIFAAAGVNSSDTLLLVAGIRLFNLAALLILTGITYILSFTWNSFFKK